MQYLCLPFLRVLGWIGNVNKHHIEKKVAGQNFHKHLRSEGVNIEVGSQTQCGILNEYLSMLTHEWIKLKLIVRKNLWISITKLSQNFDWNLFYFYDLSEWILVRETLNLFRKKLFFSLSNSLQKSLIISLQLELSQS